MRLETPKWDETPRYWPLIEGWVKAALDHGSIMFTSREVYNGLMARNMKLWLAIDGEEVRACLITLPVNYSVAKCLNLLAAGGQGLDSWLEFSPELDEYARILDCQEIEFVGREGWKKVLAPYGFRSVATIYRKALT